MRIDMAAMTILFAALGVAIAGGDSDAVKKDMKLLAGVWEMQSFETNGNPIPAEKIKAITLTIKDNRYLVDLGEQKIELSFTIDPTKKPKTIDLTMTMGDDKAVTQGIYDLTADTFKICRTLEAGKDRPTAFGTKEGSGTALAIYKRKAK